MVRRVVRVIYNVRSAYDFHEFECAPIKSGMQIPLFIVLFDLLHFDLSQKAEKRFLSRFRRVATTEG